MEQYKTSITTSKGDLKKELDKIEPSIKAINSVMPEEPAYNFINDQISLLNKELHEIEGKLTDISKCAKSVNDAQLVKQNKVHAINTRIKEIEFTETGNIQTVINNSEIEENKIKGDIRVKEADLQTVESRLTNTELKKASVNISISALRAKWQNENSLTLNFDEALFSCPTCKRVYEADDIDAQKAEMTKNFNSNKVTKLEAINNEGLELKQNLAILDNTIISYQKIISDFKKEISELNNKLSVPSTELEQPKVITLADLLLTNEEYQGLKKELEYFNNEVPPTMPSTTELTTRKTELNTLILAENNKLALKDVIKNHKAEIIKLEESEKSLSKQIADKEKIEFAILGYIKAKCAIIEDRVNKMFTNVSFKLFEKQINLGEKPCCETIIRGVPYDTNLNTGAKIDAGREIVSVFQKHYNIYLPLVVDNMESFTEEPFPVNCQTVELCAIKNQKLTVN